MPEIIPGRRAVSPGQVKGEEGEVYEYTSKLKLLFGDKFLVENRIEI